MNPLSQQDLEHLKLLSILHYVVAGMTAVFASFPLIHVFIGAMMVLMSRVVDKTPGSLPLTFAGGFFMVIGGVIVLTGWSVAVCLVVAGRSLAQRRRHLFCMVVAGVVAALCVPLGTVLGVFTILVLMRPSVKEAFGVPDGSADPGPTA